MSSISSDFALTKPKSDELARPLLRINAGWALLGQIAYAMAQCAMLIALAKFGSATIVGEFSLALSVTAPVFMFCSLQMRNLLGTDAKREYNFGDYLGLQLLTLLVALGLTLLIVPILGYTGNLRNIILVVALAKACESISEICLGLFQNREKMSLAGRSLVLRGSLSLTGLAIGLWLTGTGLGAVTGLFTAWAFMAFSIDLRLAGRVTAGDRQDFSSLFRRGQAIPFVRPCFIMAKLRGLLWLGLSLGTVNLMISLHASIPRYFVERHLGVEELGIFSAMGYVALLGSPIVQALGNTVSPRLAKHYVEGQKVPFCRLLTKTVALGALFTTCGVLVCAVAGRLILTTLFRPEYAVHANVFPWIIFGTGLAQVAQLISYGATAARYLRAQMPLLLAAVLIVGLIGAWLIPRHGLTGAASAIIASAAALFVGNIIIVQYAIRNMNVRCESV